MANSSLRIKIDTRSSLPINVQIKEQIKWLIGKELLKPGDTLPSTNQLADQLSINRNTIQWVYSQLKEENLLVVQKGRGTQVASHDHISTFKKRNTHFAFVERTIEEAYEAGYDVENVFLSGLAYMQLFGQPAQKQLKYLFVQCVTKACIFYLDEIKLVTTAEINIMDITAPEAVRMEAVGHADVIVTVNELTEVVKQWADVANKTVISVGSTNDVPLLLNILGPS